MTKSLLYLHFRKHKCENFFRMEQDEVQEAKQPEAKVEQHGAKVEPEAKEEEPEAKVEEPKQHEVLVTGGKL